MNHFHYLYSTDVSKLKKQLDDNPHLWNQFTLRKKSEVHKDMEDIWISYNDIGPYERGEKDWSTFNDEHEPILYPAFYTLRDSLVPLFTELYNKVFTRTSSGLNTLVSKHPLRGVLITKIRPGGKILPHIDRGNHVETTWKYYITINSAPGADFCCEVDGQVERYNPKNGDVYEFDNRKLHWVDNDSNEDRVSLIVCIKK